MTTKTDFQAIMELKKRYIPAQRGIVTANEAKMIREMLELDQRNDIELQNIRDTAVMLYSQWSDSQQQKDNIPATMQMMDAMSAITHVISEPKDRSNICHVLRLPTFTVASKTA